MSDAGDGWLPARWRPVAGVALAVSFVLAAVGLLWSADEAHYRGCLEKVSVEYPAVAVSAFVSPSKANVGPLKVAYAQERISGAKGCHHL
jgi:hypothetical protein